MRLPTAAVLTCLSAAFLVGGSSAQAAGNAVQFSVRGLDGKALKLSDFKGQPVVLDFWATWCVPCRANMPQLSHLQERFQDQGLVVIGLSVDDSPAPTVRRYVEKLKLRMKLGMADASVLDGYGPIRSIPTTIFINRRGDVVRRVVGYVDGDTMEEFAQEIVAR